MLFRDLKGLSENLFEYIFDDVLVWWQENYWTFLCLFLFCKYEYNDNGPYHIGLVYVS